LKSLIPFLNKVITSFLAVITNYVVAKHLGIEDFGIYSSVFSLTFILNLFSDWGINLYGPQRLANSLKKEEFIVTANSFKFALSILCTLLFLLISLFQKNYTFFLVSIPLVAFNYLNPEWVAKGMLHPHIASYRQLVFSILNLVLVLLLHYFKASSFFIIIAYVTSTLISYLIFALYYKSYGIFKINLKLPIFRFFKDTKTIFFGFLLNNLIYSLGIILLNNFGSSGKEAGVFSSYYSIFTNVVAPIMIVFSLIAPLVDSTNGSSTKKYFKIFNQLILLFIVIGIVFYTYNNLFYNILFPSSFQFNDELNKISSLNFMLFCVEQLVVAKFILVNEKRRYLIINIIGSSIFIITWFICLISNVNISAKTVMLIMAISQLSMIVYGFIFNKFIIQASSKIYLILLGSLVFYLFKNWLPFGIVITGSICLIIISAFLIYKNLKTLYSN
jgi:O-antigen/teichoic acid export membrane protein